jgi:hypothetical protein
LIGGLHGCASDGVSTAQTRNIFVDLSAERATVPRGGATQVTVTITGSGGFNSTPILTVNDVPIGVTSAVSGVGTTANTSVASITFSVALTATAGEYPLTVQAVGSGVTTVKKTFTLTVP